MKPNTRLDPDDFLHSSLHYEDYSSINQNSFQDVKQRLMDIRVLDVALPQQNPTGPNNIQYQFRQDNIDALVARARGAVPLRIILFPANAEPTRETLVSLRTLFEHYHVPGVFLQEILHGVTNGFGSRVRMSENRAKVESHQSWFQFLCKNVAPGMNAQNPLLELEDFTWVRTSYFLSWTPPSSLSNPHRATTAPKDDFGEITLICLGQLPGSILERRFLALLNNNPRAMQNWNAIVNDPYALYTIILEGLFTTVDLTVWKLMSACRTLETEAFKISGSKLEFVRLHNVAKHIIHLQECSNGMQEIIGDIMSAHRRIFHTILAKSGNNNLHAITERTTDEIGYYRMLFRSPYLRLQSMERRIGNLINLAFNLASQQDSRAMQKDSRTMVAIAVTTFFFLPGMAIATIFGGNFLQYEPASAVAVQHGSQLAEGQFFVSRKIFVYYWVVTIMTTLVTGIGSAMYIRRQKLISLLKSTVLSGKWVWGLWDMAERWTVGAWQDIKVRAHGTLFT